MQVARGPSPRPSLRRNTGTNVPCNAGPNAWIRARQQGLESSCWTTSSVRLEAAPRGCLLGPHSFRRAPLQTGV
jgi:hypothetical protein